jgi:hypothetical protein
MIRCQIIFQRFLILFLSPSLIKQVIDDYMIMIMIMIIFMIMIIIIIIILIILMMMILILVLMKR